MSAKMKPGQTAEIAGPKKAMIFPNPNVAAAMIYKAERPLLVIGSKAEEIPTDDGTLIDSAIRMKNNGVTLAATAHLIGSFQKRGVKNVHSISMMNLGNRLSDINWVGFDGKGQYDLVLFAGAPYYMEWLVLSGLKNFNPEIRTLSLGFLYQPNADWSLGTIKHDEWVKNLTSIIENLKEEN
ncbi:CO dehydrogenase/acetyl-CoA synthase complex subunit epsilon [Candidatus Bathyarchaeota archaeon]|nr:CO dehydrogenase/acetyl-CoA synthase complex subunit epsilon [Candidatus Bathyarchaeota archaeon]